jgi:hypothetical protein
MPLSSLHLGEQLGSGGEGAVYAVQNRPGLAFKRFYRPVVNARSLQALVEFPRSLAEDSRARLLRQSAWPLSSVTDGPAAVGFLMNLVPAQFFGRTAAGPKLRELQYLLYSPKPLWGAITPPDAAGRVQIAREFVALMRILQASSVTLGDISMRNLLWSPGSPPEIFILDCDSAVLPGVPPVMPKPVQTPDWDDPQLPAAGPDLDSDRYKIALVVGRILAADAATRPGEPVRLRPDIPENIARLVLECFSAAAGNHGSRPDLSRWAQALSGREMITVKPPAPLPPAPQLPRTALDKREPRETIPLPPYGSGGP